MLNKSEWGKTFRSYRMRSGLSQSQFAEAVSQLWIELPKPRIEELSGLGFEYLILSNSEISKYENGRRLPKDRSRHLALLWALHKLGGLSTAHEATAWLLQAEQPPLSVAQAAVIFTDNPPNQDRAATHTTPDTPSPNAAQVLVPQRLVPKPHTPAQPPAKNFAFLAGVSGTRLLFITLLAIGISSSVAATQLDRSPRRLSASVPAATVVRQSAPPPQSALDPVQPLPASLTHGPQVTLNIPQNGDAETQLLLTVDGEPYQPYVENRENFIPEMGRWRIISHADASTSQWIAFSQGDVRHRRGMRIGFAFDFEWAQIPESWVHFPFAGLDAPGQGSPSFAFEAGKIGIRYGIGSARGFDRAWYYTENESRPQIGRRYRVKGYYDYLPEGGASIEAWVQVSNDAGATWTEWRHFAQAHDIAIGYTASEVIGMVARGGGVHQSSDFFEGYIYGWAFGHPTADAAAADAFGTAP